jgi:hypothetical protein
MLESILATVCTDIKKFFEMTFEWIGFLFDWEDILRTRDVLAHVIDQMFEFLEGVGPGLKKYVDPKFANAQQEVTTYFNQLIGSFNGTLGSFAKKNDRDEPKMAYAQGNNVVSNAVMSNWQNAKPTTSMLAAMKASAADTDDFFQEVTKWAAATDGTPAFSSVETFFEGPSSADQFFAQAMTALLEKLRDLIVAAISGAQAVIDKALDQLKTMVASLRGITTAKMHIPLVSELYNSIARAELTPLDLVALMAAIPNTILYKAIKGAPPFPDQKSVDEFKKAFTAKLLLQASGFGTTTADRPAAQAVAAATGALSKSGLLSNAAAFTALFGLSSAVLDWLAGVDSYNREHNLPSGVTEQPAFKVLSVMAFIAEAGVQFVSAPWWNERAPAGWDIGAWATELTFVILDGIFIVKDGVMPENDNKDKGIQTVGVVLVVCGAVIETLIVGTAQGLSGDPSRWGDTIPCIPGILKVCLVPGIAKRSLYVPAAVAAFDVVFFGISTVDLAIKASQAAQAEQPRL